jgi:hypothetical protein
MQTLNATASLTATAHVEIAAEEFDAYKKTKAEIASREREIKKIVEKWEAAGLPVADAANAGEYVIVNGNKQEIGKVTISYRNPETTPRAGFWTRRIS